MNNLPTLTEFEKLKSLSLLKKIKNTINDYI